MWTLSLGSAHLLVKKHEAEASPIHNDRAERNTKTGYLIRSSGMHFEVAGAISVLYVVVSLYEVVLSKYGNKGSISEDERWMDGRLGRSQANNTTSFLVFIALSSLWLVGFHTHLSILARVQHSTRAVASLSEFNR